MSAEHEQPSISDGPPCLVCGSIFYERNDEGEDECVECGNKTGQEPSTYDWSIYLLNEGDGKLFDLRYGVHSLSGLVEAMKKALAHGNIEVKVGER